MKRSKQRKRSNSLQSVRKRVNSLPGMPAVSEPRPGAAIHEQRKMSRFGAVTLWTALALVVGCLWMTFASAQSPAICAPVEQLDKYRYLKQLTLDLYGRIPTVEEYERLHDLDDVTDQIVDEMLGSEEFYGQLRRYHRSLLWSNLGDDDLIGTSIELDDEGGFDVWLVREKRDDYRRRSVSCLDMRHTNFDTEGRPLPMVDNYTGDGCAGGEGCRMDGWVELAPYWAPQTTIKVCAFDAQPWTDAEPRSDGTPRTCDEVDPGDDALCGCGDALVHCAAERVNEEAINDALLEEPARLFEQVIKNGQSYLDAFSSRATAMNGLLSHYYRYLARDRDQALKNVASLDYQDDWQLVQREAYHSGVLTTLGYLRRFASHRARVNRLYTAFLCDPFVAPSGGLPDATDACSSNPDLSSRCGCATCHQTIEPATTHWGRWEEGDDFVHMTTRDTFSQSCANCEKGECSNTCRQLYITRDLETTPGSVDTELGKLSVVAWRTDQEAAALDMGPRALVERPEYEEQLGRCAVRNFAEHVFGRELSVEEQVSWLREQADAFASSDHDFAAMVKSIVTDERYRRIE